MKRKLIIVLMAFVLFLLQTAVLPFVPFLSATPNLMLILTVSIGFMQGRKEGIMTGFLTGLLTDLMYSSIFGLHALIYLLIGYFCGFFAKIYFDEDVKVPLLLLAGGDLFYNIVMYVTGFLLRGKYSFPGYLKQIILPDLACTLLFTLIFYRLIYMINHSLVEREKKGQQSLWIRD